MLVSALVLLLIFAATGIGNGSTYRMIPLIVRSEAKRTSTAATFDADMERATKHSSAVIARRTSAPLSPTAYSMYSALSTYWVSAARRCQRTGARVAVRQELAPVLGRPADGSPRTAMCPDVLTLFSGHLEGEIDPSVCATMEAHLAQCSHCRDACESYQDRRAGDDATYACPPI